LKRSVKKKRSKLLELKNKFRTKINKYVLKENYTLFRILFV